jgi:hypothetical protein
MANFDVKQISHIIAEFLIFGGIAYYMNSRCNNLQKRLLEDREKITDQEKRIETLETQLKNVMGVIQMMSMPMPNMPMPNMPMPNMPMPNMSKMTQPKRIPSPEPKKVEKKVDEIPINRSSPKLSASNIDNMFFRGHSEITEITSHDNEDVDSIDAELHDELAELEENPEGEN